MSLYIQLINIRENRRGYAKWTIQGNWQHKVHKTKTSKAKHNTLCVGHHYAQTTTHNVNKIRALLQTTGGKDEPNMGFMANS